MTRFQKAFCVFLCLCFFGVLAVLPGPFSLWEILKNVYRQFPLCYFLEEKAQETWLEADDETLWEIAQANGEYLAGEYGGAETEKNNELSETTEVEPNNELPETTGVESNSELPETTEVESNNELPEITEKPKKIDRVETQQTSALPHPTLDLSAENLADYDFLLGHFYIVDENTDASAVRLNAAEFLEEDLSMHPQPGKPQILIYHSHSQETFVDSREGVEEDSIIGVGNYLTELLEQTYGYQVIHVKEKFDLMSGELDRNIAYDYSCAYAEKILEENPSIEVVIDLHRDGIDENRHLVTEIDGKPTAQILFYNGLSYTNTQGKVTYLPNPYIQDNLAFSFQLEYQAALYYPSFYRGIYLAGLRYNLHLRKRALLLEAGAQTNTVQEVKNAMEPFADILNRVLKGSDKQN